MLRVWGLACVRNGAEISSPVRLPEFIESQNPKPKAQNPKTQQGCVYTQALRQGGCLWLGDEVQKTALYLTRGYGFESC